MKSSLFRITAIIFYLTAICFLSIYCYLSINPLNVIQPLGRLVLLCSACFAIYLGSIFLTKTVSTEIMPKIMKITFSIFFILYLLLISTLTLFDSFYGRHSKLFTWNTKLFTTYLKYYFNVIPFKTISRYILALFDGSINKRIIVTNLMGNLVAFIPFSFFLPLLFRYLASFKHFIIILLFIISSIELLQFATFTGTCDIDDLILNIAGASLFFGIFHFKPMKNIIKRITFLTF